MITTGLLNPKAPETTATLRKMQELKIPFWKPGYWAYNASIDDYSWEPGRWERERAGYLWLPGYWERTGDAWTFHEERWEPKER